MPPPDVTVDPQRVAALLGVYVVLFLLIRAIARRRGRGVDPEERKTFLTIAVLWGISVFAANYVLYRIGVMSFLPWINNFLHTFVWIGICLTYLYLGIREDFSLPVQFLVFASFSLIVKCAERALLGTWELDHFFHVFRGNVDYIVGWSLADGLYPVLTLYGLRLLGRRVPGLAVI